MRREVDFYFGDEGDILRDSADPDLNYNRLIRPWKSRTGLLYVEKQSLALDLALIAVTVIALAAKKNALTPHAPPGASRPVVAADLGHGSRLTHRTAIESQLPPRHSCSSMRRPRENVRRCFFFDHTAD